MQLLHGATTMARTVKAITVATTTGTTATTMGTMVTTKETTTGTMVTTKETTTEIMVITTTSADMMTMTTETIQVGNIVKMGNARSITETGSIMRTGINKGTF